MTSSEQRRRSGHRSVMAVCVLAGLAYLAVGIAGGQVGFGIFGLLLMLAYAGWLTWRRGRTETETILSGEGVDERQLAINERATAAVGTLLIVAVLIGLLASLAVQWGEGVWVFGGLAALAGIGYAVIVTILTRRT